MPSRSVTPRATTVSSAGWGARQELLDVGVGGGLAGADDGHRGAVEDRVGLGQQERLRAAADRREPIVGAGDLTREPRVDVLAGVGPQEQGDAVGVLVAGGGR